MPRLSKPWTVSAEEVLARFTQQCDKSGKKVTVRGVADALRTAGVDVAHICIEQRVNTLKAQGEFAFKSCISETVRITLN
jgi:hypothetical protein